MPSNTVSVCRPGKYGNPFSIGEPHPDKGLPMTRIEAVACHKTWCLRKLSENPGFLIPLRGKNLACFCALDVPCHADNYLDLLSYKSHEITR